MKIFKKTFKEDFWTTVIFCVVLTTALYLVIQEFAVAKHLNFSSFIRDVPEPLKKIAEAFLVLNIFGGYLHIVASVAWIILGSLYVSLVSTALIARETEQKTLGLLLSHPVSRVSVLLGKFSAHVLSLVIFTVFSFLGFYLGTYHGIIDVPYEPYRFVIVCINGLFYFLALASLGILLSVLFNEHKKAAVASLLFFAMSYLSFFLGAFSPKWSTVKKFTIFKFFDTEKLFMTTEFQWTSVICLLIISQILIAIAAFIFSRKEITE